MSAAPYYGEIAMGSNLPMMFDTADFFGESLSLVGGLVQIIRTGASPLIFNGSSYVTIARSFDGHAGLNQVLVQTSQSITKFIPAHNYYLYLHNALLDDQFINSLLLGSFSIQARRNEQLHIDVEAFVFSATVLLLQNRPITSPGALNGALIVITWSIPSDDYPPLTRRIIDDQGDGFVVLDEPVPIFADLEIHVTILSNNPDDA